MRGERNLSALGTCLGAVLCWVPCCYRGDRIGSRKAKESTVVWLSWSEMNSWNVCLSWWGVVLLGVRGCRRLSTVFLVIVTVTLHLPGSRIILFQKKKKKRWSWRWCISTYFSIFLSTSSAPPIQQHTDILTLWDINTDSLVPWHPNTKTLLHLESLTPCMF